MTLFLKEAGVRHAFETLALSETEKRAFLGALASVGKGLWGAAKGIGSAATTGVAAPINAIGRGATNMAGKALGASPQAIQKFQGLGKGMGREMASFGLLSGGLEAAMADPGDRGAAFARGFGTGALGGAAYRGGANVAKAGLGKAMGPAGMKRMETVGAQSAFGKRPDLAGTSMGNQMAQRAKTLGAKALVGGVPFAAGTAASFASPIFSAPQAAGPGMMPQGMQAGNMGMQNSFGGYNPGLPLPQY